MPVYLPTGARRLRWRCGHRCWHDRRRTRPPGGRCATSRMLRGDASPACSAPCRTSLAPPSWRTGSAGSCGRSGPRSVAGGPGRAVPAGGSNFFLGRCRDRAVMGPASATADRRRSRTRRRAEGEGPVTVRPDDVARPARRSVPVRCSVLPDRASADAARRRSSSVQLSRRGKHLSGFKTAALGHYASPPEGASVPTGRRRGDRGSGSSMRRSGSPVRGSPVRVAADQSRSRTPARRSSARPRGAVSSTTPDASSDRATEMPA